MPSWMHSLYVCYRAGTHTCRSLFSVDSGYRMTDNQWVWGLPILCSAIMRLFLRNSYVVQQEKLSVHKVISNETDRHRSYHSKCIRTVIVIITFFRLVMSFSQPSVQYMLFPRCKCSYYTDLAQIFQKSWSHLKFLDARRVTQRKFHTEDSNTLHATIQNLIFVWCILLC